MSDVGFKVSKPGVDVTKAAIKDLIVDSNYPVAKCDLRIKPKNYGLINLLINSLTAGQIITVYQQAHTYDYIPDFLTAWLFPLGTTPSSPTTNATFGIGDIDATSSTGLMIAMRTDKANFTITATNNGSSTIQGINATIRFYIFADDFSDV